MSMVEPPITTVRQPVADMARSAAELALRRLREGRQERPSTVVFRTELIERASVARSASGPRPRRPPPLGERRDRRSTSAPPVPAPSRSTSAATSWRPRSSEYPLLTPRPRWTEQDPAEWWRATRARCSAASTSACRTARCAVVGLGLTGQMHGSVFLDARGEVIRPALLWNDQRTGANSARRSRSGSAPTGSSRSRATPR